jgi:hypothetical protein
MNKKLLVAIIATTLSTGLIASQRPEVAATVAGLEKNVEHSVKVFEGTYKKSRAGREDVIEATSEAYEAVLEEAK